LDGRERSQCCVGFGEYRLDGLDSFDTLSSVHVLYSSRVSMLAAPLSHCSIFPLNAVALSFCVAGCELSIGGAASLWSKISELLSLHDCYGSSRFPEPLVVSGYDNPCIARDRLLSCSHVGDPNVHTVSSQSGLEYCMSERSVSVCDSAVVDHDTRMYDVPSLDDFELPIRCQLLCSHGPSCRLRRSSLAGLYGDRVGGAADASLFRHSLELQCTFRVFHALQ